MVGASAQDAGVVPAGARSYRARWSEWLAALTVVLAIVGMSVSSPPLVGPDESAHQATANYTAIHIFPPVAETVDYTPGAIDRYTCTGNDATKDASCWPTRDEQSIAQVRILNYPPPYYWVVGLGQKFAPEADRWMDVGGRAASVALNLAAIVLIWGLSRRRVVHWGTNLLAVTTPMVAFMWAVVNPIGWEISAGLLFGYLFARAWWTSDGLLGTYPNVWVARSLVAAASLAFGTSRHDAMVWLVLLVVAIILMGQSTASRIERWWLLAAASVGVVAGLVWQLTHPAQHIDHNPDRDLDPTLLDHVQWLGQIDAFLPRRIQQMVGVLGGQETPVPLIMVFALVMGWAGVLGILYARARLRGSVLAVGALGVLVLPSFLEVLRWNDWPYWYEGRITLPFAATFLFLVLTRYGRAGGRVVVLLSIVTAFVLTYMVWMNLMRYSFGVKDYLPLRLTDPGVGTPTFVFVCTVVGLMLAVTAIRLWWLVRERQLDQRSPALEEVIAP
jgi:hypothetical protein